MIINQIIDFLLIKIIVNKFTKCYYVKTVIYHEN